MQLTRLGVAGAAQRRSTMERRCAGQRQRAVARSELRPDSTLSGLGRFCELTQGSGAGANFGLRDAILSETSAKLTLCHPERSRRISSVRPRSEGPN